MSFKVDIWNDNQHTDNYKLFFEQDNQDVAPDTLILEGYDDDRNHKIKKWDFEICSKDYVDEQDRVLQEQIDENKVNIETNRIKNIQQDIRLDAIELKNDEQDISIQSNANMNITQNARLDDIEAKNNEQDISITNLQNSLSVEYIDNAIDLVENIHDKFKNFNFKAVKHGKFVKLQVGFDLFLTDFVGDHDIQIELFKIKNCINNLILFGHLRQASLATKPQLTDFNVTIFNKTVTINIFDTTNALKKDDKITFVAELNYVEE